MKVEIKKSHIKRGKALDKCMCPVALALKAKGCKSVIVDDEAMSFRIKGNHAFARALPQDVQRFISDFDRGLQVYPLTFHVDTTID